ncbi:MAG: AEC family transporter [Sandaracinaceae bacterium]
MWSALAALAFPVLLGTTAGRTRLLEPPGEARTEVIGPLNRFALVVAFPALVVAAWLDPSRRLGVDGRLALTAALAMAAGMGAAWAIGDRPMGSTRLPSRGSLSLVALFGNSAYLGLPLTEAMLGPSAVGPASFVVALHVAVSVTLGSYLLSRWSGRDDGARTVPSKLVTSPLAWSPLLGAALVWLRDAGGLEGHPAVLAAHAALDGVGRTASPLGLFVLGLFLSRERSGPRVPLASDLAFAVVRLVVPPLAALAAGRLLGLAPDALRLVVLLSAVPAAISTFAMAHDAGVEPERVARAIVSTTVLSVATIPIMLWLVERV